MLAAGAAAAASADYAPKRNEKKRKKRSEPIIIITLYMFKRLGTTLTRYGVSIHWNGCAALYLVHIQEPNHTYLPKILAIGTTQTRHTLAYSFFSGGESIKPLRPDMQFIR